MKNPFKKATTMHDQETDLPLPNDEQPAEGVNPSPESETATATEENDSRVRELQQQLEDSRNRHLYLLSDFENFKRNTARERMDLIQTAGRDILTALLPILDDFDRASKNGALTEGTTLIYQKLQNTLQGRGLQPMEIKPGDEFNPDRHEAIVEIPAASDDQRGKIVDIVEQGYTLGDRIIRFGKVVVGK